MLVSAVVTFFGYTNGWFRNSSVHSSWLPYAVYYIVLFLIFLCVNVLADVLIVFIRQKKKK